VCKCVLYCCHRVSTKLQLNNSNSDDDDDDDNNNTNTSDIVILDNEKGTCMLIDVAILSRYSDWLRAGRSGDWILVGDEIFRTRQDRSWGPPRLLYNGYQSFPGIKQPVRGADHPPPSKVPRSRECRAIPLPPLGFRVCYGYLYLLQNYKWKFAVRSIRRNDKPDVIFGSPWLYVTPPSTRHSAWS
jgi:hypothetical protein